MRLHKSQIVNVVRGWLAQIFTFRYARAGGTIEPWNEKSNCKIPDFEKLPCYFLDNAFIKKRHTNRSYRLQNMVRMPFLTFIWSAFYLYQHVETPPGTLCTELKTWNDCWRGSTTKEQLWEKVRALCDHGKCESVWQQTWLTCRGHLSCRGDALFVLCLYSSTLCENEKKADKKEQSVKKKRLKDLNDNPFVCVYKSMEH